VRPPHSLQHRHLGSRCKSETASNCYASLRPLA
jgi:hypothetical protein